MRFVVALLIPLPLLFAGPPAHGQRTWEYDDDRGDAPRAVDVVSTSLDIPRRGKYRVLIQGRAFHENKTDMVNLYFDTAKDNAGPEYSYIWHISDSPAGTVGKNTLYQVDGWEVPGTKYECKVGHSVDYKTDILKIVMPKECLGNPTAVRWAGYVGQILRREGTTIYGKFDDFPERRKFPHIWAGDRDQRN
jgi:hypothetical protein